MNAKDVRRKFLEYFKSHDHEVVASSSLIPAEDPTLLFANAGMNQFKDCFLGLEKRSYSTATTAQKCVRAGGKHNDLEQVGFTRRHLTFFEMLGSFSFGDYFKEEAITRCWDLLTNGYGLNPNKLYPSVYKDDEEAYAIWRDKIGVPEERIIRLGEEDNFWSMGDTGPCGPCTEVYIDQEKFGCSADDCQPGCECDRFLEIWNLVFMQYNRDKEGNLNPLKQTGVDTGMGLERLCAVLQQKDSVFETDAFDHIRDTIEKETGRSYADSTDKIKGSFNVLCDHVRSASLLIADGCSPANDGRGYVLRKIIRRAILFTQKLSDNPQLLPQLSRAFIADQHDVFPELKVNEDLIISVLTQEIERFSHNLVSGQSILDKYLLENKELSRDYISGSQAFKLYDTYGFPLELTKVIAHDHQITVDEEGFHSHMKRQQEQSKQKDKVTADGDIPFPTDLTTSFVGYDKTECSSPILWEHSTEKDRWIITSECPFYAESGGQVNDEGVVTINEHSYHVIDLAKIGNRFAPAIAVKLKPVETMGSCQVGDTAHCEVNKQSRIDTVRNHTATHMLHAALHETIGKQAKQAGSVVNKDYLRFDYTHHEALSAEIIKRIEDRVNQKIQENIGLDVFNTTLNDAQQRGIIAFFGEKYNPDNVRVVSIPGFSNELCGGTHASATGIIGCFKIVSDTALATGTRRMVAVTGPRAIELYQQCYRDMKTISEQFKVKIDGAVEAVTKQGDTLQETQQQLKQTRKQLMTASLASLHDQVDTSAVVPTLVTLIDGADGDSLRTACQQLSNKLAGFYFVASNDAAKKKASFVVHVSQPYHDRVPHTELLALLRAHDLRGGGKPGTIQGGGPLISDEVLATIKKWVLDR
jgi:alanyl-tRNA synthetase